MQLKLQRIESHKHEVGSTLKNAVTVQKSVRLLAVVDLPFRIKEHPALNFHETIFSPAKCKCNVS